jgi:hypothetical protein
MAAWAYECRPADGSRDPWYVACLAIDAMPPATRIVRVHVDGDWLCATVDRRERHAIDAMHLRDVVASDEVDCPMCAAAPAAPAPPAAQADAEPRSGRELQAAAMAVQGHRFVVVLVSLALVQRPGEADMAIADLRPRFGGVDVVLMGQEEDGTPSYHGHETLVELLGHIPVDRMPWKAYPVG